MISDTAIDIPRNVKTRYDSNVLWHEEIKELFLFSKKDNWEELIRITYIS